MSQSASQIRTAEDRPTGQPRSHHHGPSSLHTRRSHANADNTFVDDGPEEEQQQACASDTDEDLLFNWDDEQTLLWDLMEEGPRESEQDRLDMLVDKMVTPFGEKKKELMGKMAAAFVPVMRRVRHSHRSLEERADLSYGKGLILFNNACKDLESATLAEYQETVKTYVNTRANIANLMAQLKVEYDHRDRLWLDLEQKINETADAAIAEIEDTPARVERTIAKLEKYCQSAEKETRDPVISEKRLKELISKFV